VSTPRGARTESATARLSRLLTMVPWLLAHPGVDAEVAATQFGVSRAQLESDLALLFVCGTPGHLPDDLIEAEWEDGRVYIGNADAISRPLRLTVDEALTLMVGLRALAGAAGVAERAAVLGALAKLETATGAAAGVAEHVRVTLADSTAESLLADATRAIREHRRLHLAYQAMGRDTITERDVDPMRLLNREAHWYLEGWCHRAEDVRLFRLDRVQSLTVLDVDGTPPEQAQPRDLDAEPLRASCIDTVVTLRTEPGASWIADYYPVESVTELGEGRRRIVLRAADPTWLVRLAWRHGGLVTVEEPPELVARIRDGAAAALAAYPSSGMPRGGPGA